MRKKLIIVFCVVVFLFSTNVNAKIAEDKNLVYLEIGSNVVFNFIVPEIPEVYILHDERNISTMEEKALDFVEMYSKNNPLLLQLTENRYISEYTNTVKYRSKDNTLYIGEFGIQFNTLNRYLSRNHENVDVMLAKSNILLSEIFQIEVTADIDKTIYSHKVLFTQYYKGIKVGLGNDIICIIFRQGDIDTFYYNFHSLKEIDKFLGKDILSPVEAIISSEESIKYSFKHLKKGLTFDCVTLVYIDGDNDKVFRPVWAFSTQDRKLKKYKEDYVLCIDALTGKFVNVYK